MGMSTQVVGFIPRDENWEKMKGVYDACQSANVPVPEEVLNFFGEGGPDEIGREVELPSTCTREWKVYMKNGIEVDVRKLPPNVTILRFYNSY